MSTSRKGKRVAVVAVAVGLVVLGVAGYAFRDALVERYWIYRLEHGNEEAKKTAAHTLGEMKSVSAIPHLIDSMREVVPLHYSIPRKLRVCPIAGTPNARRQAQIKEYNYNTLVEAEEWAANWPGHVLAAIGSASVPALLDAVRTSRDYFNQFPAVPRASRAPLALAGESLGPLSIADEILRDWCLKTLAQIGPTAVPALKEASTDHNTDVRNVAVKALQKIQEALHALPR